MEIQIRDLLNNKREKNKIGNLFGDCLIESIDPSLGVDECMILSCLTRSEQDPSSRYR
jgi:hypothetical protein